MIKSVEKFGKKYPNSRGKYFSRAEILFYETPRSQYYRIRKNNKILKQRFKSLNKARQYLLKQRYAKN